MMFLFEIYQSAKFAGFAEFFRDIFQLKVTKTPAWDDAFIISFSFYWKANFIQQRLSEISTQSGAAQLTCPTYGKGKSSGPSYLSRGYVSLLEGIGSLYANSSHLQRRGIVSFFSSPSPSTASAKKEKKKERKTERGGVFCTLYRHPWVSSDFFGGDRTWNHLATMLAIGGSVAKGSLLQWSFLQKVKQIVNAWIATIRHVHTYSERIAYCVDIIIYIYIATIYIV